MKRSNLTVLTLLTLFMGSALYAQPRTVGGRSIILDDNAANEAYITTSLGGVGINMLNMAPNACAILDLNSQTKGFLPPRMVPAEIAALCGGTPPEGLIVYNTLTHTLDIWNGTSWTGQWQTKGNTNLSLDNVDNLLGSTALSTVKPFNLIVGGTRIMRYELSNRIQGGHPTNTIHPLATGAIIAGGGQAGNPNTVTQLGLYSVVGGGRGNTAGGDAGAGDASVGGGIGNNAAGARTTIGGGFFNTATVNAATIGGGASNTASAQYSTIGGGRGNTASGHGATVAGGGDDGSFIGANVASGAGSAIGGGRGNTASGGRSVVGGGSDNTVSGANSTIGGGGGNNVGGALSTIAGGNLNLASANNTTIAGGLQNTASGVLGSILGGWTNTASGFASTIGGGQSNTASGGNAFIGAGQANIASGGGSAIAGGWTNQTTNFDGFVGAGAFNVVSGYRSGIISGELNDATGDRSVVGGGYNNTASGIGSVVGGGGWDGVFTGSNVASGDASFVGGGRGNTASGGRSVIAGGSDNTVASGNSTIGGGGGNMIAVAANLATIAGGNLNVINFNNGTIAGGLLNTNSGVASFIGGGFQNTTLNNDAVVAGGNTNTASGSGATIGGGTLNIASGFRSTIAGGDNNDATNTHASVGGGVNNQATMIRSTVGGGANNIASGLDATVSGGWNNQATGGESSIGGGADNVASGLGSHVGGGTGTPPVNNVAAGNFSTVAGGTENVANGASSAIPGGQNLTVGSSSFGYNGSGSADVSGQSNIAYFGNVDVLVANTDNTAQQLRFYENNASATLVGADFASFQAPAAMAATTQYALPTNFGNAGGGIAPYILADVSGAGSPRQLTWISGNSSNWLLNGNSGIGAGNFIGTTDAADFVIKTGVGAVERMRFDGNPQLASNTDPLIEIDNPIPNQQGLRINGTADANLASTLAANPGVWDLVVNGDAVVSGIFKMGGSLWFDAAPTADPHSMKANKRLLIGTTTNNDLTFMTNNTEHMYVDSTGKIGIGTKDPVSFLHVRGVPPTVDSVNGAGMLIPKPHNHLVTFENVSTDEKGNGIAIILNAPAGIGPPQDVHVNNNQNYITFYSAPYAKGIRGRIEGFSWQNYWNTIESVADFALEHALDFANPLNYLTFNLDFFDFDPGFISFDPNFLTFNANFINFSGGSLPSLSGGSLPSLTGGSFSFTDGITWPTFSTGSFPSLSPGSLPSISWSAPVVLNGSPFNINGSPIINLEYPIGLNWDYLNEIFDFAANLPYKDKIAEFITNRPAAAMKFAANFFGGVTYESGSGDYAEWLERADPQEKILPGDVVGVTGGKISKNTQGTDHFMVATWKPIVLGNMPPEDREKDFTKVAFLGQVPVKIKGGCRKGDYILPSGKNDGCARALSPERIDAADLDNILGVAWDDTYEVGPTFAKVAVGLKPNEMVTVIQKQQAQIDNLQEKISEIELLKQEMAELKEAVAASTSKVVSAKKSSKKPKFRYKTVSTK